jgi:polyisoprenoid-binding protein YceI
MMPRLAAAAVMLLPTLATAREYSLSLDPQATDVSFTLEATGENVHGSLHLRSGDIRFDPETGVASGRIEIDATRADTGNKKRDRKMHSKVLESESNPLIVFVPREIRGDYPLTGSGPLADGGLTSGEVTLVGTLTLLGVEHEVALPATVTGEGSTIDFDSHFTVPYVAWGLHDPSWLVLRVAKEVDVTVEAHDVVVSSAREARVSGSR